MTTEILVNKNLEIELTINGELTTISAGSTAADLIAQLGLNGQRLALEVNQDIVSRSEYAQFTLQPNDKIEVVHAIGGG